MGRNLMSETVLTNTFAHLPDGDGVAVHSNEVKPVFDSLPMTQRAWVERVVNDHSPQDVEAIAAELGLTEATVCGLVALLHKDA